MSRDSLHTRSNDAVPQLSSTVCRRYMLPINQSHEKQPSKGAHQPTTESSNQALSRALARSRALPLLFRSAPPSLGIILHDSPAFSARETRRVERRPPLPAGRRGSSCAPLGRLIARCSARQPGLVILGRGRHLSSSRDHLSEARLWKLCQATPWTAPD